MKNRAHLQLGPRRPVSNTSLAINDAIHSAGEAISHRTSHETQPLDVADQIGIRLEQLGRVGQAAGGDDPGGAGLARSQGGGGGIDGGHVPPGLDERLGEQGGPIQAALAVDVLGIFGQARPLEGRRGARVDGNVLVLPDGRENAGSVPRRFPGECGVCCQLAGSSPTPFPRIFRCSPDRDLLNARRRRATGRAMMLSQPFRCARSGTITNPRGGTYSKGALPKTVDMPKSLIPGWYAARRMAKTSCNLVSVGESNLVDEVFAG